MAPQARGCEPDDIGELDPPDPPEDPPSDGLPYPDGPQDRP